MRNDAIEIGMAKAAARRGKSPAARSSSATRSQSALAPATDVIDEAFAGLPGAPSRMSRVDKGTTGHESAGTNDWLPSKRSLANQLAAQLEALDRQREQLAQLLRDVNVAPLGE